jgi:hypothetical protein
LKDGELLLDIETRIGELAEKEPRAEPIPVRHPASTHRNGSKPSGQPPKHERLGMQKKRMHEVQQMYLCLDLFNYFRVFGVL